MKIKFTTKIKDSKVSLLLVGESLKLPDDFANELKGALKISNFKGKKGEYFPVTLEQNMVILFGVGDEKKLKTLDITKLGGQILAKLNAEKHTEVTLYASLNKLDVAANIGYGALLRSYRFDKYRTTEPADKKPTLTTLNIICTDVKKSEKEWAEYEKIANAISLSRDLVSEPPNVIYPESFAKICADLKDVGVNVTILDKAKMQKLGMNALLGVAQGSAKEAKLVVMEWNGGKKGAQPIAFVGKGVTFDTGGISIKPSTGMEDMKYDMAGAAAVTGVVKALATRNAKVNVVGIIGLVENMPGGNAQRPSDVVTSMSGQTIEVLNTDAEGRLVLADALWYCQDKYKPKFMVDLATLTGAIVVTFGSIYAGLFSNDDDLAQKLLAAGIDTDEKLWRLPIAEEYNKQIDSDIADVQNISNGKGGGSITAAKFLERFVNKTPWAHLDIAGVAWTKTDMDITPKGATGFGVRLLEKFVRDNFEG